MGIMYMYRSMKHLQKECVINGRWENDQCVHANIKFKNGLSFEGSLVNNNMFHTGKMVKDDKIITGYWNSLGKMVEFSVDYNNSHSIYKKTRYWRFLFDNIVHGKIVFSNNDIYSETMKLMKNRNAILLSGKKEFHDNLNLSVMTEEGEFYLPDLHAGTSYTFMNNIKSGKQVLKKDTIRDGQWDCFGNFTGYTETVLEKYYTYSINYKGYVKDNDVLHGYGELSIKHKKSTIFEYKGVFCESRFHGHGNLTISNNFEYMCSCMPRTALHKTIHNTYMKNSHEFCFTTVFTKTEYEGEFTDSYRDGYGTLRTDGGDTVSGTWKNGKLCGRAKIQYEYGDLYEGETLNNQYHGEGVLKTRGKTFIGSWVDGNKHGKFQVGDEELEYDNDLLVKRDGQHVSRKRKRDCEEFYCPITREIMRVPVVCSDGYTYERSAIEKWCKENEYISPMTKKSLEREMVLNRNLKKIIEEYDNIT